MGQVHREHQVPFPPDLLETLEEFLVTARQYEELRRQSTQLYRRWQESDKKKQELSAKVRQARQDFQAALEEASKTGGSNTAG